MLTYKFIGQSIDYIRVCVGGDVRGGGGVRDTSQLMREDPLVIVSGMSVSSQC